MSSLGTDVAGLVSLDVPLENLRLLQQVLYTVNQNDALRTPKLTQFPAHHKTKCPTFPGAEPRVHPLSKVCFSWGAPVYYASTVLGSHLESVTWPISGVQM
eukprot:3302499-Pyramimonas_sp.AAC.2